MAELVAADVQAYTKGRLLATDGQTTRLLNAALDAARRYCGWHVTPVRVDTGLVLDGPGRRLLSLPTMRLVELQSITEDGATLDAGTGIPGNADTGDLLLSPIGVVRKKSGCWSCKYGAITVTMNHGYDDAIDWQAAVLEMVDRMAGGVGMVAGASGPLTQKSVDDVTYEWAMPYQAAWPMLNRELLAPYRIEPL